MRKAHKNDAAPLAGEAGVNGHDVQSDCTHAERMVGRILKELRRIHSGDLDGLAEEALLRGDYRRAYAIAVEKDRRWEFVRSWARRYGS